MRAQSFLKHTSMVACALLAFQVTIEGAALAGPGASSMLFPPEVGVPQSGGPQPFASMSSYELPRGIYPADNAVLTSSGKLALYDGLNLTVFDQNGVVVWSRTIAGPDGWTGFSLVAGEDDELYLVSVQRPSPLPEDVLLVSAGGEIAGHWNWPDRLWPLTVSRVTYLSGWLVLDRIDGRRLLLEVRKEPAGDPDDLLSPDELAVSAESRNDKSFSLKLRRRKIFRDKKRTADLDAEYARRERRIRKLGSRRYPVDALPFFKERCPANEGMCTRLGRGGELLSIAQTGEVVVRLPLVNPLGLSSKELFADRAESPDTIWPILVWYDSRGRLVRYFIVSSRDAPVASNSMLVILKRSGPPPYRVEVWGNVRK